MRQPHLQVFLCLCLVLCSCQRRPRTRRSDPDPPVPVPTRPQPAAAKPDAAVPRPDAGPAPGARNLPRPTPLGKEAFLPTVPPPTWKVLQPLVKAPGLRGPIASSQIVPLGGARFAAVARMTERTHGKSDAEIGVQRGEYALFLIVVEPAGASWKVAEQLRAWNFSVSDPCQSDTLPVRVTPVDLDHDGRVEIELRIAAAKSERAVGCIGRTHLLLVELTPAPRVVLVDNLDASGVYVTRSILRYVDLNGDGFPDVSITETTRRPDPAEEKGEYAPNGRRYLYDPARDGYLLKGKLLTYPKTPRWRDPNDPPD